MAQAESFIALNFQKKDEASMQHESDMFYQLMCRRRSVREFSEQKVPPQVLQNAILAAGTAPSGANMQPWHFVVVTNDAIKKRIREASRRN